MPVTSTVPDSAWSWLQRSRDVVQVIAERLTGEAPGAGFVDALRPQFTADAFVRDVVVGAVVDVAFNGRVPARRPSGASWDRGLTWWAAACAGITVAEFERRSRAEPPPQERLFGGDRDGRPPATRPAATPAAPSSAMSSGPVARPRARLVDRAQVAQALRGLLAHEQDGSVPAAAVRALLGQLERDVRRPE